MNGGRRLLAGWSAMIAVNLVLAAVAAMLGWPGPGFWLLLAIDLPVALWILWVLAPKCPHQFRERVHGDAISATGTAWVCRSCGRPVAPPP
jgi:fatty acid desaturase